MHGNSEYIAPCDARLKFISGFTGSAGTAIVTDTKAALWTDGRYHLQAQQEVDENWEIMKDGIPDTPTKTEWLVKEIPTGGNVGTDPCLISAVEWDRLHTELHGYNLNLLPVNKNLIDEIWEDRPAIPNNPLLVLPEDLTGCSWPEKIEYVRSKMLKEKATICIFTQLGEIAYLFNMRGSDIKYNPLFFSYAIVEMEQIHLFIDEKKITQEIRNHLTYKGEKPGFTVKIHPYEDVVKYLPRDADVTGKVWISSYSPYNLVSLYKKENVISSITPISLKKAIKNSAEIAGMRKAHIKDGVCLSEFYAWLEKEVPKKHITEMEAARKLEEIKRNVDDFISPSFSTISAVGSNAAIIHYRASPNTDKIITDHEIFLCDSGSQYRCGTTDVTRTVHFGTPTVKEQECFTRVLKGHINLATTVFPEKLNGNRLDILARTSLWEVGLDYLHGTGHGVGAFLEVHEGPCTISMRLCKTNGPIEEGMILTDEPGYYEKEKYGFRIENALLVVKKETKYQFESTKFLTFEPLTLVPIQKKMILTEMLTVEEKCWLDNYHQKCLDIIGPILLKEGKHEAYNWLKRETSVDQQS
ncbi:xaa-Pro aminopeptidase 1 isoform X2 [Octopus bimaculoides]|uniref:Aminopeptidase P N-terminal domain-containing protein n=1 Tax=Octopus bimaculoides TaxID=37653 RepID=A0A0L8H8V7_OCTBM|nr:xaa-Pro aminopeptidase 1 isoform X2 [Octopus bimaculoides]